MGLVGNFPPFYILENPLQFTDSFGGITKQSFSVGGIVLSVTPQVGAYFEDFDKSITAKDHLNAKCIHSSGVTHDVHL